MEKGWKKQWEYLTDTSLSLNMLDVLQQYGGRLKQFSGSLMFCSEIRVG